MCRRSSNDAEHIYANANSQNNVAAYHGDTQPRCVADGREVLVKPCRGSDSGSNPDAGAPFLIWSYFRVIFS
jgi:hypothetical protein